MLNGETNTAPSTPTASMAATIWSPVTSAARRACRPKGGPGGCVRRREPGNRTSACPSLRKTGAVREHHVLLPAAMRETLQRRDRYATLRRSEVQDEDRAHRRHVAISAPSARDLNFAHTTLGATIGVALAEVPKSQSALASTRSRPTMSA